MGFKRKEMGFKMKRREEGRFVAKSSERDKQEKDKNDKTIERR